VTTLWYTARAGGMLAFALLTASVVLGLALAGRSRLKPKRLSYRLWRRTHYLNFAVWALALVHGITSGTDSGTPWALGLYALAAGSVGGLLVWRASGGGTLAAVESR
jgi:hypothetical protein